MGRGHPGHVCDADAQEVPVARRRTAARRAALVTSSVHRDGVGQATGPLDDGANKKDIRMSKDTKKVAAARSRAKMGGQKRKAAAKVSAVRRAVRDVLSERQTTRRSQRQQGKIGR